MLPILDRLAICFKAPCYHESLIVCYLKARYSHITAMTRYLSSKKSRQPTRSCQPLLSPSCTLERPHRILTWTTISRNTFQLANSYGNRSGLRQSTFAKSTMQSNLTPRKQFSFGMTRSLGATQAAAQQWRTLWTICRTLRIRFRPRWWETLLADWLLDLMQCCRSSQTSHKLNYTIISREKMFSYSQSHAISQHGKTNPRNVPKFNY